MNEKYFTVLETNIKSLCFEFYDGNDHFKVRKRQFQMIFNNKFKLKITFYIDVLWKNKIEINIFEKKRQVKQAKKIKKIICAERGLLD